MSKRKLQRDRVHLPRPQGVSDFDRPQAFFFDDACDMAHLEKFGVRFGDVLVGIETKDVQAGDLAWIEERDGAHVGRYFTAPADRFKFEGVDGTQVFHTKGRQIVGRIIGVLRAGKYVAIDIPIRPLTQGARDEWTGFDVIDG
jgi:hypothetical protein